MGTMASDVSRPGALTPGRFTAAVSPLTVALCAVFALRRSLTMACARVNQKYTRSTSEITYDAGDDGVLCDSRSVTCVRDTGKRFFLRYTLTFLRRAFVAGAVATVL